MKFLTHLLFLSITCISLNAQVQLDSLLIAHYPLDGNSLDASGNGHHGQAFNTSLGKDRFGNPNSAYSFNGYSSYIVVPDAPELRLSGAFAVSLWAKVFAFSNVNTHAFISKRNGLYDSGYLFQIIGYNHLAGEKQGTIIYIAGTANPSIKSYEQMQANDWFHVVIQSDPVLGKSELFINGELQDVSNPILSSPFTNQPMFIGKDFLTEDPYYTCCDGFHFFGLIDDIRIYQRVLTTDEIRVLYGDPISGTNSNIRIFPNPASSVLFIQDNDQVAKTLEIITLDGKTILSVPSGNRIDLPSLPAGIYIAQVKNSRKETLLREKIVISQRP